MVINMHELHDMNPAQRKAVTQTGGPLLVLAGPGSGKTFTITRRILHLLEQGTPPEQLLVITFTREAAMSMQHRFQTMSKTFQPVNFGTFHSVFYHILQKSNVLKNQKLLTNSEKKRLLFPILKEYQKSKEEGSATESLGEDCTALLSAFSYYKNTLRLEEAAAKSPAEWQPVFGQILERYQRAAQLSGRLDFDDMLSRCRELLAGNKALLRGWQERFRYILIDEFQDINPVQYEVVKLLAGEHCHIFAVGDDDQAIYGFRGSEPECLRRFEREYRAERLLLDVNYRSHPQIVRASLAVIGENRDRFEKQLRPSPDREKVEAARECDDAHIVDTVDRERVRLLSFPGREEQYAYLIRRLLEFLQQGQGQIECAVLFRTNSYMQGLAVRLKAAGIPYVMGERMQSIYEHFIAKDIMAYLSLAAGKWEREALLRVVNRPSRYVSREAVGNSGRSVRELIAYYEAQEIANGHKKRVIAKLRNFERQLEVMGGLSPGLAVAYIQKAVGYEKYLQEAAGNADRWAGWKEMLEWLKEDACRFTSAEEWLDSQEAHTRDLEQKKIGRATAAADNSSKTVPGIRLMTVHGAKGLEFDTVIVADCNETIFPHGRLQTQSEIEEERRVFYVAMTRAKENLELLYLIGTRERPRLPSRFLNPLL